MVRSAVKRKKGGVGKRKTEGDKVSLIVGVTHTYFRAGDLSLQRD